jgi:hypothetical protein
MSERDKTLRVEALTYSDSYDSLVDRHFRGRSIHRAEDAGPYNVTKMLAKFGARLARSRQEYLAAPSGISTQLEWASLCFQLEERVFLTVMSKGNAYSRGHRGDEDYKVTVAADSPAKAAAVLADLRREFLANGEDSGPAFFIMTGGRRTQRAPLEAKHLLDQQRLALHYGEEFTGWAAEFLQNLGDPGISILRGETGTGKTSFLRHAMCALARTHRFYFVPVDNFGLLSSGSLTEFWKTEHREHPSASKVLVLEDAENLLAERGGRKGSPVAALLNLTDGLMTQLVQLHLICTLNCKIEAVDPALLRPGRLRFFKSFERIPRQRALLLAEHYQLALPDRADFTLAEIFASPNFAKNTAGATEDKKPVGFAH